MNYWCEEQFWCRAQTRPKCLVHTVYLASALLPLGTRHLSY
jgi:hypothetical protein